MDIRRPFFDATPDKIIDHIQRFLTDFLPALYTTPILVKSHMPFLCNIFGLAHSGYVRPGKT